MTRPPGSCLLALGSPWGLPGCRVILPGNVFPTVHVGSPLQLYVLRSTLHHLCDSAFVPIIL